MDSKNVIYSKTFWFNAIGLIVALLTGLIDDNLVKENPGLVKIFGTIILVGNIILRYFTEMPVHIAPKPTDSMMILLAAVCLTGSADAAEIKIYTWKGKPQVILEKNGKPVLEEATIKYVPLDEGTSPIPDPPTNPGGLSPFEMEVAKQTRAVLQAGGTTTTGAAISGVFSLVSDSVDKGTRPFDQATEAVRVGVDFILTSQPDRDKWRTWRNDINNLLADLQRSGDFKTKAQIVATLKSISKAINSETGFNGSLEDPQQNTTANAALFGDIDIDRLMELLKLVMRLLEFFK